MKVFVTRPIPENGINLLKQKFEVVVGEDKVLSKEELKQKVAGFEALLTLLSDKIDREILEAAGGELKIVANYAVGFDNIDLEAAKQRKVYVTNTPGVLTEAVAEHTFALLLAVARKIVASDKFVREGKYQQWEPMIFLGKQLWQNTIGIVGLGRIGSYVAKISTGFRMKIIYHDVKRNPEFEATYAATHRELPDLLREADFVTIHVPLLDSTRHLISTEQLNLMKKEAILINTSRGPVIEEAALVKALRERRIAAAGLDVFENEPNLAPGLAQLDNVVLTPHTASATLAAREAMSLIAAKNIIEALEGRVPPNHV